MKLEIRESNNGDTCIMSADVNCRIATFSKGTKQEQLYIKELFKGNLVSKDKVIEWVEENKYKMQTVNKSITDTDDFIKWLEGE